MLDFNTTDFSTAEDINSSELMPHGTVAMFTVAEVGVVRPNSNGKKFFTVTFEVVEGPFTGKQIKENYYLEGKDFALQKTKIFVRYVLETTLKAHENGSDAYKIKGPKALETGRVVAKVKVKGFPATDTSDWIHTNEIDVLATPREDSSTHKIYKAYTEGEQPWQSDWKPERPSTPATGSYGDSRETPPVSAYAGGYQ